MKIISIVTVNLNMKNGLERSIKSLVNQNQKENIEYIVVDGLSSDGSREIIKKYSEVIDKVIIEKDKGIFDAMNKGIDIATGKYIYFLNSGDEFSSSDVIEKVIEEIKKDNCQNNIYCGKVATFRFGKYLGIANLYPWIVHQSAFVKTSIMKEYKFDTNFKILGDLDLWRRFYNHRKYNYYKIDKVIANLELDGIGSNPKFIFKRLEEKKYYAKKHNDYSKYMLTFFINIIGYFSFKIFGEKFYYCVFLKYLHFFKIKIKSLFKIV